MAPGPSCSGTDHAPPARGGGAPASTTERLSARRELAVPARSAGRLCGRYRQDRRHDRWQGAAGKSRFGRPRRKRIASTSTRPFRSTRRRTATWSPARRSAGWQRRSSREFRNACRLFAPLYRQVTLSALHAAMRRQPDGADRELPYADVRAAWRDYLAHDNHGRPFVLIGHSQGSALLKRLLAEEIDGKPVQRRLLSAILPGTAVLVPKGKECGRRSEGGAAVPVGPADRLRRDLGELPRHGGAARERTVRQDRRPPVSKPAAPIRRGWPAVRPGSIPFSAFPGGAAASRNSSPRWRAGRPMAFRCGPGSCGCPACYRPSALRAADFPICRFTSMPGPHGT